MSQKSVFHHPWIQCWALEFKTKQTSIRGSEANVCFLTIWWYFTRLSTELSKNSKMSKFVLTWISKCKQSSAIASFQHEFDMFKFHQLTDSLQFLHEPLGVCKPQFETLSCWFGHHSNLPQSLKSLCKNWYATCSWTFRHLSQSSVYTGIF